MKTRDVDLRVLNSLTKYPSIPTFHALGEKGSLLPQYVNFDDEIVYATEKVDGTNTRIVLMPDGRYIIGSREEFLHADGDLIYNPALGIVESIKEIAEKVKAYWLFTIGTRAEHPPIIRVLYFETYGGKTTANAKQYTGNNNKIGHRLFDICDIGVEMLDMPLESISGWRENNGQTFFRNDKLAGFADKVSLTMVPRVQIKSVPSTIEETYAWMKNLLPNSFALLDDKGLGRPEGIVIRTRDRSKIAKIRFEDYERHLKRLKSLTGVSL